MSFVMDRIVICSYCKKREIASKVNFPENLHDTLMQLKIPNLHWICVSCENSLGLLSTKSLNQEQEHLSNGMKELEISINENEDETMNFSSCSLDSFENIGAGNKINKYYEDSETSSELSEDSSIRNKSANTIINEILKKEVVINKEQLSQSKAIFTSFINEYLIPFFKKTDEMFAEVFQSIYYTGSSYNDLKISEADEYDVNIILSISKQVKILPNFYPSASMFSKLVWEIKETPSDPVKKFLEKFSGSKALDPLKIGSWLQSLVDKFIKSNPKIPEVDKVKYFQSGPARSVLLETSHDYSISIDLVPVFQFDVSCFSDNSVFKNYNVDKSKQFWFLIPKPCRGEQLMLAHEIKLSWRVHLPEVEKAVLYNKQCAKPVIKLLKLLRDKQNWKGYLSSYHCKTVVFWELKKHPDSKEWNEKFLYEKFLEALKSLIIYFKDNRLPYLFDETYNLFFQLNETQAYNMYSRLSAIVKDIEKDTTNLKKYFKYCG